MRIAGIVTEFNPITYGHLYLINKIKSEYNMDSIISVMSPNFVMRGEPAIISKIERTKMALKSGIDLVLELPTIYAVEAADIFASRSIEILNTAGITDLFFGVECDDINLLKEIAKAELSKEYIKHLKEYLKEGLSFNTASKKSLYQINPHYEDILKEPNNSLAIEYIKAIISNGYNIEIHPIKRVDSGYYDGFKKNTLIQSASFLRDELKKKRPNKKYFPYNLKHIEKHVNDDYFELIKYKIISSTLDDLRSIHGITDGFENKLKSIKTFKDYDTLVSDLVSKRDRETKVKRILIYLLLNIKKEEFKTTPLEYIKVLGFNENGQDILKIIKKKTNIISSIKTNMNNGVYRELDFSKIYYLTNDLSKEEYEPVIL